MPVIGEAVESLFDDPKESVQRLEVVEYFVVVLTPSF